MNRYPLARYHQKNGTMRIIASQEEEAALSSDWMECQTDVKYPANPAPIIDPPIQAPFFVIELPDPQ